MTLTAIQRTVIRDAATQAYDKARWCVGDSSVLYNEMLVLAHDSYCAGLNDQSSMPAPAANPKGACRLTGTQLKGPAPDDSTFLKGNP